MSRTHLGLGGLFLLVAGCGGGGGGGGDDSPAYLNVLATSPDEGSPEASVTGPISIVFDNALASGSLGGIKVQKRDGQVISGTAQVSADGKQVLFTPESFAPLEKDGDYQIRILDQVEGVNGPLLVEHFAHFQTEKSFSALPFPQNGAIQQSRDAELSIRFSKPVNPSSVHAGTVWVELGGNPVDGSLHLMSDNKVVSFRPAENLFSASVYKLKALSGTSGVRSIDGDLLPQDLSYTISTGAAFDSTLPTLNLTVLEIPQTMNQGLRVLPDTVIDLVFDDGLFGTIHPGSVFIAADKAVGTIPAGANLVDALPCVTFDYNKVRLRFTNPYLLPLGSVTFSGTATDPAGNLGTASSYTVEVVAKDPLSIPFENVQPVWVRFDLDRNQDGVIDFQNDLIQFGLNALDDPYGLNASVQDLIEQKILAKANALTDSNFAGRLLFKNEKGKGPLESMIAVGGRDMQGGAESNSSVLGRAWFDADNANPNDDNTVTGVPHLGVFPGTLHSVYAGQEFFGFGAGDLIFNATFDPLMAPDGTPVGSHPLDATVIQPGFDYLTASLAERQRYDQVFLGIERFSKVIAILLAHEMGHSVGLVPDELHGFGFHNKSGFAADVMLSSVSFTTMVLLEVRFRPLNNAYLLEEITR